METATSSHLYRGALEMWQTGAVTLDDAVCLLVRSGVARISLNFHAALLARGTVLMLFPDDVVEVADSSPDFHVEALFYNKEILREACVNIETEIYESLREDALKEQFPALTRLVGNMLDILRLYEEQLGTTCFDSHALLQLKSFFLGYADHISSHADRLTMRRVRRGKSRTLFKRFMHVLATEYKQSRDVVWYARQLCVTPKHLNEVVRYVTGLSAKQLIDEYVLMQLQLVLRSSSTSLKELAYDFHFSSPSFFNRYFKQRTRQTPQEYRNKCSLQA